MSQWNEVIHARLVELLKAGSSRGEAAKILNAQYGTSFTRNAIIGRTHRTNVTYVRPVRTAPPPRPPKPQRNARTPFQPSGARAIALAMLVCEPVDTAPDTSPFACTLLQLKKRSCRWPLGDPKDADFRLCGDRKLDDVSYCARHYLMAYTPPSRRPAHQPFQPLQAAE
jgi:GcrA cell cycle regulator